MAFLIPIVERLLRLEEPLKKHHVGAIIISPTRELATQIYSVLTSLLAFHGPSAAAISPLDDEEMSGKLPTSVNAQSTLLANTHSTRNPTIDRLPASAGAAI